VCHTYEGMYSCNAEIANVWPMASQPIPPQDSGPGITKTGRKKTLWLHADEAEALRVAAFEQRRPESDIVREALRRYLGIED
jgi:hypothetical protein